MSTYWEQQLKKAGEPTCQALLGQDSTARAHITAALMHAFGGDAARSFCVVTSVECGMSMALYVKHNNLDELDEDAFVNSFMKHIKDEYKQHLKEMRDAG